MQFEMTNRFREKISRSNHLQECWEAARTDLQSRPTEWQTLGCLIRWGWNGAGGSHGLSWSGLLSPCWKSHGKSSSTSAKHSGRPDYSRCSARLTTALMSEGQRKLVQAEDRRLETREKATEEFLPPPTFSLRSRNPHGSAELRRVVSTQVRLTLASNQAGRSPHDQG